MAGYTTLEQGFAGNTYTFAYSRSEPSDKRTSKTITIELDPTDHAVVAFSVDNLDLPSAQGGNSRTSSAERKNIELAKLHLLPDSAYKYELSGNELSAVVEQLLYAQTSSYYHNGQRNGSSGQITIKSYEVPPSAKVKLTFID